MCKTYFMTFKKYIWTHRTCVKYVKLEYNVGHSLLLLLKDNFKENLLIFPNFIVYYQGRGSRLCLKREKNTLWWGVEEKRAFFLRQVNKSLRAIKLFGGSRGFFKNLTARPLDISLFPFLLALPSYEERKMKRLIRNVSDLYWPMTFV